MDGFSRCRNKSLAARIRHMPSANDSSISVVLLKLLVLIKQNYWNKQNQRRSNEAGDPELEN